MKAANTTTRLDQNGKYLQKGDVMNPRCSITFNREGIGYDARSEPVILGPGLGMHMDPLRNAEVLGSPSAE